MITIFWYLNDAISSLCKHFGIWRSRYIKFCSGVIIFEKNNSFIFIESDYLHEEKSNEDWGILPTDSWTSFFSSSSNIAVRITGKCHIFGNIVNLLNVIVSKSNEMIINIIWAPNMERHVDLLMGNKNEFTRKKSCIFYTSIAAIQMHCKSSCNMWIICFDKMNWARKRKNGSVCVSNDERWCYARQVIYNFTTPKRKYESYVIIIVVVFAVKAVDFKALQLLFNFGFKVADSGTAWILSIALDWLWEQWTRRLWLVWIVYFCLFVNSHQSCFDRGRARFSLSRVLLIAKPLEVAYIQIFQKGPFIRTVEVWEQDKKVDKKNFLGIKNFWFCFFFANLEYFKCFAFMHSRMEIALLLC